VAWRAFHGRLQDPCPLLFRLLVVRFGVALLLARRAGGIPRYLRRGGFRGGLFGGRGGRVLGTAGGVWERRVWW